MHIFITGASGIIGSYTAQYLLSRGHSITAVDVAPLPDHLKLPTGSVFTQVDCTDFVALEKAMLQIPCDGVIHLGAIPNPKVSISSVVYA
jgi:nucleoside-diphosphate-sugar epimerase